MEMTEIKPGNAYRDGNGTRCLVTSVDFFNVKNSDPNEVYPDLSSVAFLVLNRFDKRTGRPEFRRASMKTFSEFIEHPIQIRKGDQQRFLNNCWPGENQSPRW